MARKTRKSPGVELEKSAVKPSFSLGIQQNVFPDVWAKYLRLKVDGHAFDIKGREYQMPIFRDESEWIVMPKGAQMGLTTVFLVRSFHWIVKRKWHHLYLLPLKTGAIPFVQGRIDPIIDSNPKLASMFKSVDNRLHKQTNADIALRIRGTNIWTELREIPADALVMDERDKMVEENIPEAMARLDGSHIKRVVELSTPTAPGHGVDSEDAWPASDQNRWYVPCPHCSRRQVFTVDENVVIGDKADECAVRCSHCRKEISDLQRAEINALGSWEPEHLNGTKRGYHISQLNSPTQPISKFMANYFAGQTDARKLKAWHNNNLGIPYVAFGDQVTPEMLDKCRGKGHTLGGIPEGPVYVGVDVGNFLHVRANYLDRSDRAIGWDFKLFTDTPGDPMWEKLDRYLATLGSFTAVIDAHPEKSEAKKLALKYHKKVWIGFEKDSPDQAETAVFNNPGYQEVGKVNIDRTAAFDTLVGRIIGGRLILPADARTLGEKMSRLSYNGYYHQMCQMVGEEVEDTKGRMVRRWVKNKNPDHWHHAEMFAEIATYKKPYVSVRPEVGELFKAAGGLVGVG